MKAKKIPEDPSRGRVERNMDKRLRKTYNLTLERYEEIHDKQGGVCAICGDPSPGRMLSVDHDHKTGMVRGLLCNACNHFLGLARDDPCILRRAVTYLKNSKKGIVTRNSALHPHLEDLS